MPAVEALLTCETWLLIGVILCVSYTEIDWRAYMDEVRQCVAGQQLDYTDLRGGTGPLVYPGGFVWLFSGLWVLTKGGDDISLAQCIFALLYVSTLGITVRLHRLAGVSLLGTLPLFLSKRSRSLFVLRLFNDCWAVWIALLAVVRLSTIVVKRREGPSGVVVYQHGYWYWGTLLLSIAISIKMNILLFLPGLLCIMLYALPLPHIAGCAAIGLGWQLAVGAPFLLHAPTSYVARSFEWRRVFEQRWSVNYQFVSEDIFVHPLFHAGLGAMMCLSYVLVWRLRWRRRYALLQQELDDWSSRGPSSDIPRARGDEKTCLPHVLTLLESNLIGVAFSRSMHYQFFTWTFFSMLFVLHHTRLPTLCSVALFWAVQYGFELYPPTPLSSALVTMGFTLMVMAIIFLGRDFRHRATTASPTK